MANKNHAGAIVYTHRQRQERIDEDLDRRGVAEQIRLSKPDPELSRKRGTRVRRFGSNPC